MHTKKVKIFSCFGLLYGNFFLLVLLISQIPICKKIKVYLSIKTPYTYYQIQKKNDELAIRVLSLNDEITAIFTGGGFLLAPSYRVYEDGTIDIPFISNIYVEGLTVRQAAKVVEEKLHDFVLMLL